MFTRARIRLTAWYVGGAGGCSSRAGDRRLPARGAPAALERRPRPAGPPPTRVQAEYRRAATPLAIAAGGRPPAVHVSWSDGDGDPAGSQDAANQRVGAAPRSTQGSDMRTDRAPAVRCASSPLRLRRPSSCRWRGRSSPRRTRCTTCSRAAPRRRRGHRRRGDRRLVPGREVAHARPAGVRAPATSSSPTRATSCARRSP